ncbi:Serine/threonine-protein kinase ark1, partial [Tetrabaena socialis]
MKKKLTGKLSASKIHNSLANLDDVSQASGLACESTPALTAVTAKARTPEDRKLFPSVSSSLRSAAVCGPSDAPTNSARGRLGTPPPTPPRTVPNRLYHATSWSDFGDLASNNISGDSGASRDSCMPWRPAGLDVPQTPTTPRAQGAPQCASPRHQPTQEAGNNADSSPTDANRPYSRQPSPTNGSPASVLDTNTSSSWIRACHTTCASTAQASRLMTPGPEPAPPAPAASTVRLLAVSPSLPLAMRRPGDIWRLEDFSISKRLYKGSTSAVYRAVCLYSGLTVALKVYFFQKVPPNVREIEIHSQMAHKNVLRLYAAFMDEQRVVLVLEHAARGDLYGTLRRMGGRMSAAQAVEMVMRPLVGALASMHSAGVCHRDIKVARDFISASLAPNPSDRPTAAQLSRHAWLMPGGPGARVGSSGGRGP